MSDPVNHPAHYKGANGLEAIEVIEGFGLGFRIGNAVKYLLRAGRKGGTGDPISSLQAENEDLRKAAWYIARKLAAKERAIEVWPRIDKVIQHNKSGVEARRARKTKKGMRR